MSRRIKLLLTIIIIIFIGWWLFSSPASNNETATIERNGNTFLVTLTGERVLMAHDLISALGRGTYVDTFYLNVPRASGIIDGREIPTQSGYYQLSGKVEIDNEIILVDLYYDNHDDKRVDRLGWNGKYKLIWKTN